MPGGASPPRNNSSSVIPTHLHFPRTASIVDLWETLIWCILPSGLSNKYEHLSWYHQPFGPVRVLLSVSGVPTSSCCMHSNSACGTIEIPYPFSATLACTRRRLPSLDASTDCVGLSSNLAGTFRESLAAPLRVLAHRLSSAHPREGTDTRNALPVGLLRI